MSLTTYLYGTTIRSAKNRLEGKIYTRPTLVYSDGVNLTYACDVDIGHEGIINENGDIGVVPVRNVPISNNNRSLYYAEIGQPVTLTRNSTGHWEVTGFAKSMPGTFSIVPVTLPTVCHAFPLEDPVGPLIYVVGEAAYIGLIIRPLTYDELGTLGSYGITPYGAIGVFENGTLTEIRSS